ncbi:MAG: DUF429 domain-containing protein [Actinomycetota bacterium]
MHRSRSGVVRVAGVDGCRHGWVVVEASVAADATADAAPAPTSGLCIDSIVVTPRIAPVVSDPALSLVAIDMPIGLPEGAARDCDRECRAALGPRRSSVFPTPTRSVLDALDYADALARQRHATGSGISLQAWNLVPRIAELDAALGQVSRRRSDRIVETHPELAFATLTGDPMRHPKRTTAGRRERLAALRPHVAERWRRRSSVPTGAAPDDVLDALVLAIRAAAWSCGGPVVEFGDGRRDGRGRLLRIRG